MGFTVQNLGSEFLINYSIIFHQICLKPKVFYEIVFFLKSWIIVHNPISLNDMSLIFSPIANMVTYWTWSVVLIHVFHDLVFQHLLLFFCIISAPLHISFKLQFAVAFEIFYPVDVLHLTVKPTPQSFCVLLCCSESICIPSPSFNSIFWL